MSARVVSVGMGGTFDYATKLARGGGGGGGGGPGSATADGERHHRADSRHIY
ncbi:hypothetical protein SANTM175S_05555 [Streptomyces antimycoticus]